MPGLSCSMQELVLWLEIEPGPLDWGRGVSATGPPGKSLVFWFKNGNMTVLYALSTWTIKDVGMQKKERIWERCSDFWFLSSKESLSWVAYTTQVMKNEGARQNKLLPPNEQANRKVKSSFLDGALKIVIPQETLDASRPSGQVLNSV